MRIFTIESADHPYNFNDRDTNSGKYNNILRVKFRFRIRFSSNHMSKRMYRIEKKTNRESKKESPPNIIFKTEFRIAEIFKIDTLITTNNTIIITTRINIIITKIIDISLIKDMPFTLFICESKGMIEQCE
jgi:hypothetical protein